jgi:hypothetical protein
MIQRVGRGWVNDITNPLIFWLLCFGTLVMGIYNASGQYYRFAAADVAPPEFKSRAISLVLAGGLVGGILGPETAQYTKDLLSAEFMGSYLVLILFCTIKYSS